MSKKKILFIITHLELGGAQKQLLYIIEGLDKDKYSLYLCCGESGHLKKKFLELSYLKIKFIPSLVREINTLLDLITFFKLFSFIKKHRFDIVHTHSPKASFLGRWAAFFSGVRNIIYTVHGWPFHKLMSPFSYYIFLFLEKITAKITKKIVVVSKDDFNEAVKKKISRPNELSLIHYGVDMDRSNNIFDLRRKGVIEDNLIVNVSSLKPQKGLSYFLEMANVIIKEGFSGQFLIIGDGPYKRRISERLNSLGLQKNVLMKGWIDDISPSFIKASVVVLSSLWEGLPVSVIEAVTSGIPLVVTDTGGVQDLVVNGKQGIVVQPQNTKQLSEAVLEILQNYNEWDRTVRENRDKIDLSYWSKERMIEGIGSIYEGL